MRPTYPPPLDPAGDRWVCAWCGYRAPVPYLARQCEQRHLRDDDGTTDDTTTD